MPQVSFDDPFYFLTSVTHKRLPIFRTETMRNLLCRALDEARTSAGLLYFAYVLMEDHFHIITDGVRSPSDTLRYLNGISARRVVDHLKEKGHDASLAKLRQAEKKGGYKYSVWEHHSDKFILTSESKLMEKVNYIHQNPLKDGIVEHPDEYYFSSARIWHRRPREDEPLSMDIDQIDWRHSFRSFR